jgi:dienelactone hydrolase
MYFRSAIMMAWALGLVSMSPMALSWGYQDRGCLGGPDPVYSNVEIEVKDVFNPQTSSFDDVVVKAILTQPVEWVRTGRHRGCFALVENPSAVVILHGSGGIGVRENDNAQSLQAKHATLTVEMFQGSLGAGTSDRPPLPVFNYTHAFAALTYLVDEVGADPGRIGCMGSSWGAVICNQVAVEKYAKTYGSDLYENDYRFAAHVVRYPVCWARKLPEKPLPLPLLLVQQALGLPEIGLDFGGDDAPLTGAKVLVQVGSEDAYDNAEGESGSETCSELKSSLHPSERRLLDVDILAGGTHAFDRVFTPETSINDPFARLGSCVVDTSLGCLAAPESFPPPSVIITPSQDLALQAQRKARRFLDRQLLR